MKLWVARSCVFCKGGYAAAGSMGLLCPSAYIGRMARIIGASLMHLVTGVGRRLIA